MIPGGRCRTRSPSSLDTELGSAGLPSGYLLSSHFRWAREEAWRNQFQPPPQGGDPPPTMFLFPHQPSREIIDGEWLLGKSGCRGYPSSPARRTEGSRGVSSQLGPGRPSAWGPGDRSPPALLSCASKTQAWGLGTWTPSQRHRLGDLESPRDPGSAPPPHRSAPSQKMAPFSQMHKPFESFLIQPFPPHPLPTEKEKTPSLYTYCF